MRAVVLGAIVGVNARTPFHETAGGQRILIDYKVFDQKPEAIVGR